jgi:sporulation protein YlmC with PRC-barrel domain
MIRATTLGGRAVVDVDAAEELGKIDKVILDPDARRVAGFVVSRGSSFLGRGTHLTVPSTAVHAVGPDAITVRGGAAQADTAPLDGLPCVSDIVGRRVVSRQGRFVGTVRDVLIDAESGRIIGYALSDRGTIARLDELLSGPRPARDTAYLRADADLRAGRDLIVAPDDALAGLDAARGEAAVPPAQDAPMVCRWADPTGLSTSSRPSGTWTRRAS